MNSTVNNLILLSISTFTSYILLIKIIPLLTLDIPNSRSSHKIPVYRGGGIIFVLISFLTIPFTQFYSLLVLLPLIIISYLDDLHSISPKIRYLVQLVTVYFIVNFNLNLPIQNQIILVFILIIGTGIINFTNFIDGIDGLLTSNMIIAVTHMLIINQNTDLYPLLGSLIAFLILNKSPAKVFMGDVGSTFLGAVFFMEIIKLTDLKIAFLSFIVTLPIYLDAFLCVIARFLNNENIFSSHKKHLYQRLVGSGINHNIVSLIYSFCSILIAISCYTYNITIIFISIILVLITGLILNKFYAKPFLEK